MKIKTILHIYNYVSTQEDYKTLCGKLKNIGLKKLRMYSEKPFLIGKNESFPIELDTDNFLTDNQWNTSAESPNFPNTRVFDWFESYNPNNQLIRTGHWIEQSQEMRDLRYRTFACGYCGHKSTTPGFCEDCLGSQHLDTKDFKLLRKLRMSDAKTYGDITEEEFDYLYPIYVQKQSVRAGKMLEKRIEEEKEAIISKIEASKDHISGLEILKENGCGFLIKWIFFYDRTREFTITTKNQEEKEELEKILKQINFPYKYKVEAK